MWQLDLLSIAVAVAAAVFILRNLVDIARDFSFSRGYRRIGGAAGGVGARYGSSRFDELEESAADSRTDSLIESIYEESDKLAPASIYVSGSAADGLEAQRLLSELLDLFDLEIFFLHRAEDGSWFRRMFLRAKGLAETEEVSKRLADVENALKLRGIDDLRSQVDERKANAAAALIAAVADQDEAVMRVGSLVVVKRGSQLLVETIDEQSARELEADSTILKRPADAAEFLQMHRARRELASEGDQLPASNRRAISEPDEGS
jgi:hypothetical protein